MARYIAEGRIERHGYKNFLSGSGQRVMRTACHLVVSRRSEYLPAYRRIARDRQIELTVNTWESTEEAAAHLYQLDRSDVHGVICDPPAGPDQRSWVPAARQLVKHGIPVVTNSLVGDDISSITGNVEHGIEQGVKHLGDLGHRELALVTVEESAVAIGWQRCCAEGGLRSSTGRICHDFSWVINNAEADALADLLAGEWRDVTGLVIRICHWSALQRLLDQLARKGRRVPAELSIFAVGNAVGLQSGQPRITSASIDMALWIEMSFDLLQREMRMHERVGVLPPPAIMQVMPRINLRESTAAPAGATPVPAQKIVRSESPASVWTGDAPEEMEEMIRQPYSLAAKASLSERPRFSKLDLRTFANRPLRFRRGWLGDLPLLSLPPGEREIHGVPFEILGGSKRTDMGAVVFSCAVNETGNARKLPDTLRIPIGSRVDAVYILHGCGYANPSQAFARYTFYGAKGKLGAVQLVSLGRQKNDANLAATAESAQANIQDWWSDFPHVDFPHARMVPLLDDEGNAIKRHVYLYTLEWINPFPTRVVSHLEIVSDPSVPTTLGMLAITLVKPRNS